MGLADYLRRLKERIAPFARPLLFVAFVISFSVALYWVFFSIPPPGYAIALLSVVALVMTLMGEIHDSVKIIWILLVFLLFYVELSAIHKDRAEQARVLEEQRGGVAKILKNQQEQFEAMLTENHRQFSETLESTQRIGKLAQESLRNITGGDSVPYIVPQNHAQTDPLPLMIWNHGKYILSGVSVVVRNSKDYASNNPADFFKIPEMQVGVVHPGFGKLLRSGISPHPDESGIDVYLIEISTQSETFTETLQFRRGKYSLPWAYRYWVNKHTLTRTSQSNITRSVPVFSRPEWSDDLGDGKPTTKP